MLGNHLSADTFGDRFDLSALPLPRPPAGYAVQQLDSDLLLDRCSGRLLPIRTKGLDALFASFDDAFAEASQWVLQHCDNPAEHRLAIVPASYDPVFERPILIYGVLCGHP